MDRRPADQDDGWDFGQPVAALGGIAVLADLEFVLKLVVQFRGEAGIPAFAAIVVVRYTMLARLVAVAITAIGRVFGRASTANAGGWTRR